MKPRARSLLVDERGLVHAQLLLVYLPVVFFFFATIQIGELAATHLVFNHALYAGSRKAIVTFPNDPKLYANEAVDDLEGPLRQAAVMQVVRDAFRAAPAIDLSSIRLEFAFVATGNGDEPVLLETRLSARAKCIGGTLALFVCGPSGSWQLNAKTRDLYHGARYKYASSMPRGTDPMLLSAPSAHHFEG
jgi:hypothetical protein